MLYPLVMCLNGVGWQRCSEQFIALAALEFTSTFLDMTGNKKRLADYIPLIVLIISAIILLWRIEGLQIKPDRKHYLGVVFIGITIVLFLCKHLYGVLSLGISLFLGLIGIYSFDPDVLTTTYFAGAYGQGHFTAIVILQPVYSVWLILHFLLSRKTYANIFTKNKY
jgi:hypothetical protein